MNTRVEGRLLGRANTALAMGLLNRDRRLDALQRVPAFRSLSQREIAAVSRLATEIDAPTGKTLARRGERGHEFMLILDGTARVDLAPRHAVRLGPGDFFGEMSLLDGEPRSADVIAETPMRLLVIGHRDFWSLLYEVPQIARKIMVALSQRLREAEKTHHA